MPRVVTLAVGLSVGVAACAGPDSGANVAVESTVRDSAGIEIVESGAPVWPVEGGEWRVDSEPVLAVGILDGDEAQMLSGVIDPLLLSDGTLVFGDRGSQEIRSFAPDGTLRWRVGGEGEGPGEFGSISWLGRLPGDSIMVWDIRASRTTVFAPDGALGRTYRTTPPEGAGMASPVGFISGDLLLVSGGVSFSGGEGPAEEVVWPKAAYWLADLRGTVVDSVTAVPSSEVRVFRFDGNVGVGTSPYARSGHVAAGAGRVLRAVNTRPEVEVLGLDGTVERIFRIGAFARAPTAEDRRRYVDQAIEDAGSDADAASVRRRVEDEVFPEAFPYLAALRTDPAGHTWVRRWRAPWDPADVERWWILGTNGGWLGEVAMPTNFELERITEDAMVGVATDALGVERVQVHRLRR